MTQVAVGTQIFQYKVVGKPGKLSPVLILHGWGRNGAEWVSVAKKISDWSGRQVYILDLPGFGGSSLPEVVSIEEYTNLVAQFCKYLKIKKVMIVCHSLGARVGIVWSSGENREMVEKMILVDPAGPKEFSWKRWCLSVLAVIFRFVPEKIRRVLITPLLDEDYRRTPALRRLYRVVVSEDLGGRLAQIHIPVKLVWGDRDTVVPLRMVDVYKKYLSDVSVRVIWGAGHDPHLSHPQQLMRALEEIWI